MRCIICEMHQVSTQENIYKYLLCCCLLHSRPLEMFVQLTSQHCCSSYICCCCLLLLLSAYATHATGHRSGCGKRSSPRHRILPRPLPPLHTQPNPYTLQQIVTEIHVQSIPSARFAIRNFAAPRTTLSLENAFFSSGNSRWDIPRLQHARSRYIRHAYGATHRAPTHLPVGIQGVRTHASTSLLRVSAVVLCLPSNGDWRSRSLKNYLKFESSRIKLVDLGCELC